MKKKVYDEKYMQQNNDSTFPYFLFNDLAGGGGGT